MEDPNQEKKSRFDLQPHYIEWGLTALGVIVACVLVVFVLFRMTMIWGIIKKFFSILSSFIYGFVMAYLLMPVFNMLYRNLQPPMSRKFKNGTRLAKGLCSALTLAFGLAVVGVLLWMVLPQLVTSITSLVDSMDLYMNEISGWVASLLHNNPEIEHSFMRLYDQFSAQIMNWAQNDLLPQLGNMMSGVVTTVNVLMNLLIGVIIAMYILNSKDTLCAQAKKMTYSLFKVEKANAIMARVAHIHRVFGGFITGKLMDSSIIGMLCFIGMRLMISFGWMTMPTSYALLIAVIIGVTNIIPFFGPFIGAIPSTILIMVISPVQALYFVIFVLLLQQFDGT
ncbi:MAG: AI-2E family transporter, partial [Butyricicoccaceae bacterium]